MQNEGFSSRLAYPLDVEHMWEMDRLEQQGRLITEQTNLFPPDITPKEGQVIVDVACGPGEWAAQVAQRYPHCQVIGIDLSEQMIAHARYRAQVQNLSNVRFEVADVHDPLTFANNALDIVNARFLAGFLTPTDWSVLFGECFRVLRPGGILCSTEFDGWGDTTTSTAVSRLDALFIRLYQRRGQCFSEAGDSIGIMAAQPHLFQKAGFVAAQQQMHSLDCSAGTPAHEPMAKNLAAFAQLSEPILVHEQLISQEEHTVLSMQLLKELYIEDFHAVLRFQTAWGKKPLESAHNSCEL
jgi:ubiquinone/menaquinone biosynthesis C-methylase UbiE